MKLPFDIADHRAARAAWTRLTEPADPMAGLLLRVVGPEEGLRWLLSGGDGRKLAHDQAELSGDPKAASNLSRAAERWRGRLEELDPVGDLKKIGGIGGRFMIPTDPDWPHQLADLQDAAPHGLWLVGNGSMRELSRSVAIVGCRAATAYGVQVTGEITHDLVQQRVAIVSGGAYGIDAAAHRSAIATGGATAAVLASGLDRWYPAGNHELFRRMVETGILLAEAPPGAAPSRFRFLHRNRLIAALAGAVLVVEAAHRSGAISTAHHALTLGRELGAVPGPVTSIASEGCHRLLREGYAHCISDASHVLAMLPSPEPAPVELDLGLAESKTGVPARDRTAALEGKTILERDNARAGADKLAADSARQRELETLGELPRLVYENVPLRSSATAASIAKCAGLALGETLGALGRLELHEFVKQQVGQWKRETEVA